MSRNNRNMRDAARIKNDEFYTLRKDIENEMKHYKKYFAGKTVYCNCDDPYNSNFFKYFAYKFHDLGLNRLITSCYKSLNPLNFSKHNSEFGLMLDYNGEIAKGGGVPDIDDIGVTKLDYDGCFSNKKSIKTLKEAHVVVTNPPFSRFEDFVKVLIASKKKFIIIGNLNALAYKDIFPLVKANKIWLGCTTPRQFENPDKSIKKLGLAVWFTNIKHYKRNEGRYLKCDYSPKKYPFYDNYNAININRSKEIPRDYDGYMGVPVSFLTEYSPDQFEVLGIMNTSEENKGIRYPNTKHGRPLIKGKEIFLRVIIRRKA